MPMDPRIKYSIAMRHRRCALFLSAASLATRIEYDERQSVTDLQQSSFLHSQIGFQQRRRERRSGDVKRKTSDRFNQTKRGFAMMNDLFGNRLREEILN